MEAKNIPIFLTIGVLTAKTSPWLGWEVRFDSGLTASNITTFTPLVEKFLNDYLKNNVDFVRNNLVVPFTCRLVPTGTNALLYNFKVEVFRKLIFFKFPFPYPPGPILSVNNFTLVKGPGVESQASSIALKPPAPVRSDNPEKESPLSSLS